MKKGALRLKSAALAVLLIVSATFGLSCGNRVEDDSITIVTTSFPLYDTVRQLAHDDVKVVNILPWGADGHDFDPSIGDVNMVARAKIFVYSGDSLEAWALKLAESAGGKATLVDASKGIKLIDHGRHNHDHDDHDDFDDYFDDDHDDHDDFDDFFDHDHDDHDDFDDYFDDDHDVHGADPHIWISPKNMLTIAKNVYDALEAQGLADRAKYDSFVGEIEKLDRDFAELSQQQSKTKNTLFFGDTFAFLYLMNEYGFEYMSAYPGCSDEAEPSVARMTEVSNAMKASKTGVIFKAERSSGRVAESIAPNSDVKVLTLHSCHNISKQELENGATYISLMRDNYENIKVAIENVG